MCLHVDAHVSVGIGYIKRVRDMARPKATEKQKSYIRVLQMKNNFKVARATPGNYLDNMSKERASEWIQLLLDGKDPKNLS